MAITSNIKELINQINNLKKDLEETRAEDLLKTSIDAIGLLRLRIARGENSDGGTFSDYSPNYAKKRAKRGRQISKKNYVDTGILLGSFKPEVKSDSGGATAIEITARGQDNLDKLYGALSQGDELLELSESEIDILLKAYENRRLKRINL